MSNGSREQMKMTAGVDLGDKYSYLYLIDTESGEVIEEGRLRTTQRQSGAASIRNSRCISPSRWAPTRPG
jgi:hypothetical protein